DGSWRAAGTQPSRRPFLPCRQIFPELPRLSGHNRHSQSVVDHVSSPQGADMRRRALAIAVAALASAVPAHAQTGTHRVFVLDQGAPSVTAVDLQSGKVLQTAALEGSPSVLLRTHDGKRLLVLDHGTGKDAGDAGFQAKTQSALPTL